MIIAPAERTRSVSEYYFSRKLKEIDALNAEREAAGLGRVINLGIGAPDGLPPQEALDTLVEASAQKGNHAYQPYVGLPALREAFASWYRRYYGVSLDPRSEIQPLTGSKEGILLICLAFIDKGDRILVPDPGYPTYTSAARMAEAEIVSYPLREENSWQPDLEAIEKAGLEGVKLMFTNYPHMPTGAPATPQLYQRLAHFGRKHGILIVNDNPYSFILNDRPLSILAAEGADGVCLELNSLSKAHNMSGWRIGMVGGNAELVSQVLKVKSQMDSGMFKPLQLAAVKALESGPEWFASLNEEYRRRKEVAGKIFDRLGARYDRSSQGLFLWGRVDCPGTEVSDRVLYGAGVFITPGFIFGKGGENYIRISLCAPVPVLEEALEKIEKL